MESLVKALRYFGGGVKTVLAGNQKAAVLKNHNGNVVFNADFLHLAQQCNFQPRTCRHAGRETRGKAERMAEYLKYDFFVRYTQSGSFAHVNSVAGAVTCRGHHPAGAAPVPADTGR